MATSDKMAESHSRRFPTTSWTMVSAAGHHSSGSADGLSELCAAYCQRSQKERAELAAFPPGFAQRAVLQNPLRREEIAATVAGPEEVDGEIRFLLAALERV